VLAFDLFSLLHLRVLYFRRLDLISGHHLVLKIRVQVLPSDAEEIELSAPGIGAAYVQANFN
jgi:hypothetical protein